MDGINLIQDLAIVLLCAGIAGSLCRRIGLSVIVGYLVAGVIVGPYTPPFSLVLDTERIQTLSQIGLVFLMFNIGLGLSLSKLGRMGVPTLLATALGAFFVLNLTEILGHFIGWTPKQSLFLAAMFMVSSSAVIAKIVGELHLSHERSAQQALSITVLEDVVAVTMLTILASQTTGEEAGIGRLLTGLTAFVMLLVGAGLLLVPRLLRRLEAKADPELQTIIVAGVLFLLALSAVKAGYSLALGAFLLGAIVAEIPQKVAVEKAFAGMRDLFSSVFFVSIGMLIEVRLLWDVWPAILGLGAFVLVGRGLALTLALILSGTRPHDARRAGLLLGPLGEFSFIIAQLGVSSGVLPASHYPLAVGVSILTVLVVPLLNRHAEPILALGERLEPLWFKKSVLAYHGWLEHLRQTPTSSIAWRFIRGRLLQLGTEVAFVTGLLLFSQPLLELVLKLTASFGMDARTLSYSFWAAITVVVLIPLVAIWRNLSAIAMIYSESVASSTLPFSLVHNVIKALSAVAMAYWIHAILPYDQLGGWGWVIIGTVALVMVAVFSRKLIYWYSEWHSTVKEVLTENAEAPPKPQRQEAVERRLMESGLQEWEVRISECIVPDAATYAGQSLAELSIPARFDCVVLEVERNGIVITTMRPDLCIYPGDKLLMMGEAKRLKEACAALNKEHHPRSDSEDFRGSVLETLEVPQGPWCDRSLANLNIGRMTGTRIVGIRRGDRRIIAPSGQEHLMAGDNLLVTGTLREIEAFRRWFKSPDNIKKVSI